MTIYESKTLGNKPLSIIWNVVRGDTAILKVKFFELDEKTLLDTSTWKFEATAFNKKDKVFDELEVTLEEDCIVITADSNITEFWGTGIAPKVGELRFDLEVTIDGTVVWTPIIGSISVIGDVTGARL